MKTKPFSFISISDIHLNHSTTTTTEIITNLNTFLLNPVLLTTVNAIFIIGDFWDKLVDLENPNSCEIKIWINKFLHICKKYDIIVYIMEGTFTHDRRQSRVFITENTVSNIGCKLKYIDTVAIEYLPEYDLNVLFVPDDYKPNPDDTWKDVVMELEKKGLDKVDFSFTHGTYEHHLPSHVNTPRHINSRYESITKYAILNGHIHIYSINGKIMTNGSFDRISQGEEGPKGFIKIELLTNGSLNSTFIENKNAKRYITIDCRGLSLEDCFIKINTYLNNPVGTLFRLHILKNDAIGLSMKEIKNKYSQFIWSPPKIDKAKLNVFEIQNNIKATTPFTTINKDSIITMVSNSITHNDKCKAILQQCKLLSIEELQQKALKLLVEVLDNGTLRT